MCVDIGFPQVASRREDNPCGVTNNGYDGSMEGMRSGGQHGRGQHVQASFEDPAFFCSSHTDEAGTIQLCRHPEVFRGHLCGLVSCVCL